jgi:hypothetical protein
VELLRSNDWYRAFLPNHPGYIHAVRPLGTGGARRVIEPLLRNPLVGWFERWEMERKIARLACPDPSEEVRFSASTCKGHFDGHRERVLAAFEDRRRRLAAAAGEPRR